MLSCIQASINAFSKIRKEPWQNLGDVLLIGEGNLSFSKSLLSLPGSAISSMTTTTYEPARRLSNETLINMCILRSY